MDMKLYALLKGYINKCLDGLGALKGSPCEITDIETDEKYTKVTFSWEGQQSGQIETSEMTVLNGISIDEVELDEDNNLYVTFDDEEKTKKKVGTIKTITAPVCTEFIEADFNTITGSINIKKSAFNRKIGDGESVLLEDIFGNQSFATLVNANETEYTATLYGEIIAGGGGGENPAHKWYNLTAAEGYSELDYYVRLMNIKADYFDVILHITGAGKNTNTDCAVRFIKNANNYKIQKVEGPNSDAVRYARIQYTPDNKESNIDISILNTVINDKHIDVQVEHMYVWNDPSNPDSPEILYLEEGDPSTEGLWLSWLYLADNADMTLGEINANSASASKLQTARRINNVAFDGTKDIKLNYQTGYLVSNSSSEVTEDSWIRVANWFGAAFAERIGISLSTFNQSQSLIFEVTGNNSYNTNPSIFNGKLKLINECHSMQFITKARLVITNNTETALDLYLDTKDPTGSLSAIVTYDNPYSTRLVVPSENIIGEIVASEDPGYSKIIEIDDLININIDDPLSDEVIDSEWI